MELPEWLRDWQVWTALTMLLGVAELFSLDLVLLMLAAGAAVGAVTALLGLPLAVQVLAAVGTSVAMLAVVRPSVVKRLHSGPELRLGHDALVGRQATVVAEVTVDGGQVRIGGELWSARAYDESSVIAVGSRVDVFAIQGATALVHEVPGIGQEPPGQA